MEFEYENEVLELLYNQKNMGDPKTGVEVSTDFAAGDGGDVILSSVY